MKQKNNLVAILAIAIILSSLLTGFVIAPSTARAATTTITNCAGLVDINNDLAGDYVLANDIDCSGIADWAPLGTFTGKLDGANYTIDHLTILGFTNGNAFFGNLDGAKIFNLNFTNVNAQTNFVGGILTTTAVNGTKIVNVHVQGSLVSGAALSLTGGLVGVLNNSDIYYSSADITLTGFESLGGLVGVSEEGSTISFSYATGSINQLSATATTGGLVGNNNNSSIFNSYAQVSIGATGSQVGGLVGLNQGTGGILNSYAVSGIESEAAFVGGLVGKEIDDASTISSFWNTDVYGPSNSGTGKNTAEMKTEGTFTDWDFTDVWQSPDGDYPTLFPYDSTPVTLTEVTNIPHSVTIGHEAMYHYDTTHSQSSQETLVTDCGNGSIILAGDDGNGHLAVDVTNLQKGKTYTCEVTHRNLTDQLSNALVIGPFRVISAGSVGAGYEHPVNLDNPSGSFEQPTPLPPQVQIAETILGPNNPLTRDLYLSLIGNDVKLLQKYLNSKGFVLASSGPGSPGNETDRFGKLTRDAVIRFQKANKITPAAGYVGPKTRSIINN